MNSLYLLWVQEIKLWISFIFCIYKKTGTLWEDLKASPRRKISKKLKKGCCNLTENCSFIALSHCWTVIELFSELFKQLKLNIILKSTGHLGIHQYCKERLKCSDQILTAFLLHFISNLLNPAMIGAIFK